MGRLDAVAARFRRRRAGFPGWIVRRSSRGQSVIELAIALPLFLLIALGAVDVGRLFFDYIGFRNAAMEGAIYGARNPMATEAEIATRAEEHDPDAAAAVVTADRDAACASVDGEGFVTVTITTEFEPLSLTALDFLAPEGDWVFTVNPAAKARCMT